MQLEDQGPAQKDVADLMHQRRNLTLVRNVCEEIPRSLFWARNKLNELPEECFEFSFALIGKSTMAFLTGQSWSVLKSWYTGGDPQQGFGAVLQINLLR